MPADDETITTLPILNNKGGIGKTTTAINLAAGLGQAGHNILLVDLDSQASASVALGLDRENLTPSSAEVLFEDADPDDAIRSLDHEPFDLLPASLGLADADVRLVNSNKRHHRLAGGLAEIRPGYDFILLDCPPSTSLLTLNAVVAADALIVPVSPAYLALEGVVSFGNVIKQTREHLDYGAPVLGLLLTLVDSDAPNTRSVIDKVRSHYGDTVFSTEIRQDPALPRAAGAGESIFSYDADSSGAEDYRAFTREALERIEQHEPASAPATPLL